MSLVGDALRKARQDRGFRGEPPRGGVVVPPAAPARSGPRLGIWVLIGVLAGAAIAVAGGAAVWWAFGYRGEQLDGFEAIGAQETRGASPEDTTESRVPGSGPDLGPADVASGEQSQLPPAAAPETNGETGASRTVRGAESVPEKPAGRAVDDSPPAAVATDKPRERQPEERVFLVDADLGYAVLSVDYIVYRSEDPFVQINGLEVHEGGHVAGFVVEKIERDLVRLRDDKGPVIIRVHVTEPKTPGSG